MSEKTLWRWFQKGTRHLERLHLQRVENCLKRGVLDVEGCYRGVAFWLELKAAKEEPVNPNARVACEPLKPEQQNFITHRLAAGGNVWLLYGVGRHKYLMHGSDHYQLAPHPKFQTLVRRNCCHPKATPQDIMRKIKEGLR